MIIGPDSKVGANGHLNAHVEWLEYSRLCSLHSSSLKIMFHVNVRDARQIVAFNVKRALGVYVGAAVRCPGCNGWRQEVVRDGNDLATSASVLVRLRYPAASCLHPGSPDGKSASFSFSATLPPPSLYLAFLRSRGIINATTDRSAPCARPHHAEFLPSISTCSSVRVMAAPLYSHR